MGHCGKCGSTTTEKDIFCQSCGVRLKADGSGQPEPGAARFARRNPLCSLWSIAGAIFGLVAGANLAGKASREMGDQFGAGILLLLFWVLAGALGTVMGALVSALRAALAEKRGWEKVAALLIFSIPLSFFSFNIWESMERATYLPKNSAAQAELRNAKTCLEAYYMDNRTYPASFEQTGCSQAKDVEIVYVRTSPHTCQIRSSHRKADKEYRSDSDETSLWWRYKNDPNAEWQPQ